MEDGIRVEAMDCCNEIAVGWIKDGKRDAWTCPLKLSHLSDKELSALQSSLKHTAEQVAGFITSKWRGV